MTNPVQEARRLGQSIWYDNMRRGLLTSGELQRLIDLGVSGVTSNPTIFEKAIAGSTDYDDALPSLIRSGKNPEEAYEALAIEDIQAAADLLRPIHDETDGVDGFVSLEVSPKLAHDAEGTVEAARRLYAALDRPNVMIKVPATPEGVPAFRQLTAEGISVNVTLLFSVDVYRQIMDAYIAGLEELSQNGGDLSKMGSVASFFVSRVDTAVDGQLETRIRDGETELTSLLGKAAITNGKIAYDHFSKTFARSRFKALRKKGARVQRLLFGSTGTKNPAYSEVYYVEPLIGRDTVNTVPPATLTSFLEQGVAALTITNGLKDARNTLQRLADAGISMRGVTDKLLADGVKSFADSFDSLLENVEQKQRRLLSQSPTHPLSGLGEHRAVVETALSKLDSEKTVDRIWRKDHTVWKNDSTEIADRLGWLNVTEAMREQVEALSTFAEEVRDNGFTNAVLLGMGGSSLGPEVLRQTFGSADGYPTMHVLDSTVPAAVEALTAVIDPAHTLFLVSSKSGTTVEALSFYRHFRMLVGDAVGHQEAGESFIAITDPGSPLEQLAEEEGFRRVYLNPADIGGRYSVLSYFGLVPASLMGVDISKLLSRAEEVHEATATCVPAHVNPGAWLGAAMATMAKEGRDKMTLVTSPGLSAFGLWVEQLIAESTGKEGVGIVPVAGESLLDPGEYGDDRLFIYARLEGDDNDAVDATVADLRKNGHPVLLLELRDRYDLGGEFFRWEFATAVAGSVLGIHPFDQPNVQQAKDLTSQVLQSYRELGLLPAVDAPSDLAELFSQAKPGDYLAIMAYVRQTPEIDGVLAGFRRDIAKRLRIATTLGYGPRFLHSTGQLHKGGPGSGLFLQIVDDGQSDVPIPGEEFSFGVLAGAQALGDLQALQAAGRRVARIQLSGDGLAIS